MPAPFSAISSQSRSVGERRRSVLVIACGALAEELQALRKRHGWEQMALRCLPAELHNRPKEIPSAVATVLHEERPRDWGRIFVAYGDCGTGGLLDPVLDSFEVERLPGPHCYAFFRGVDKFNAEHDDDPTCFFLTDFLARHFDTLIWRGFGIEEHPELCEIYFRNYTRLVFLSQTNSAELRARAQRIAGRLGLIYEERHTGLGHLATALAPQMAATLAPDRNDEHENERFGEGTAEKAAHE